MALKALFNTMKKEGYIIKPLDNYLLSLNKETNDRAIDVNAPSQVGRCKREIFYARKGYEQDPYCVDARARRIFDNGTHMHERIQTYLKEQGMLIMDEVPLRNDVYNIQGHTDGFIQLTKHEIGILELKSINDNGFKSLNDAKLEHKEQAMVYIYCAEHRRQYLRDTYKTEDEFKASEKDRIKYYKTLYTHLKDGSKYTREEKLNKKVSEHLKADDILFHLAREINKVVFLYENKNTQELKEFTVRLDDELMDSILERYVEINNCVENDVLPQREGTSKSANPCRFCNYTYNCWVI